MDKIIIVALIAFGIGYSLGKLHDRAPEELSYTECVANRMPPQANEFNYFAVTQDCREKFKK